MNERIPKPICVSEMRHVFDEFIMFKRSLGLKYVTEEKTLRQFCRYCEEHYPGISLPEDAVYNWITDSENRSLKTRANHAVIMSEWAKYAFSLGYIQMRIPEIRHSNNTAFVPHIFTMDEMRAIWNTVDNITPLKRCPNLHKCIPVLFRLLYACGLRISEALQITAADIDFNTNVITLKYTKLDKERLIPMSESLAKVMRIYIDNHAGELKANSPIFYYKCGQQLTSEAVYKRFRKTLEDSGIPYEGKSRGPRLHDFRHTFSVVTMNKLCDEGNDLYVALPVLSAYLGHSGIKSTERYIRLTEDRLATITDSLQFHLPNVFPEVKENAEF